jgi:hypothetical protein
MDNIITQLKKEFEVKEETPDSFLGMEIRRDRKRKTITLSQTGYIDRLLEVFGMTNCHAAVTPGEAGLKLPDMSPKTSDEEEQMKPIPYANAVGKLLFLNKCSLPDISFEVSQVAQFNKNPGVIHWKAVKRIIRYLKGTRNKSK